jgi:hypothetical protein
MKRDYAACNTFCIHCLLLFGAFTSNFLAELISRKHPNLSHVIPIALEMIVLIGVGIFGYNHCLVQRENGLL